MTANNVVKFPSGSKNTSDKDVGELLETNKIRFAENLVDHYGTQLLSKLVTHGLEPDRSDFMYDYLFVMEALRATILRNIGVEHPMHELIDTDSIKYFQVPPEVTKGS